MTSPAKIRANRRNALRSTGPRSRRGKQIAARNACRHRLTLPVACDPVLAPEVEALARTIETSPTGAAADAHGHALACRIAEAEIHVRRVRQAKLRLFAALEADPGNGPLLRRLAGLDWYEGRAFSRRTTAIRAFDAARAPARRLRKRTQHRNANDFRRGWLRVMRYAHRLLTMPAYTLGPIRLPRMKPVARIERSEMRGGPSRISALRASIQATTRRQVEPGLRKRSQRRNPSDINAQPTAGTTNGMGCVAPRDPVGSPTDKSPANKTRNSELTPHGEVET